MKVTRINSMNSILSYVQDLNGIAQISKLNYKSLVVDIYTEFCDQVFFITLKKCHTLFYIEIIKEKFSHITDELTRYLDFGMREFLPHQTGHFFKDPIWIEDTEESNPIQRIKNNGYIEIFIIMHKNLKTMILTCCTNRNKSVSMRMVFVCKLFSSLSHFLTTLRRIKINLYNYMDPLPDKEYWRYRITSLMVFFIDDQMSIIPNEKSFGVQVEYPLTYYDVDWKKEPKMFARSDSYWCNPQYHGDGKVTSSCELTEYHKEYIDISSTSPNGTFMITLLREENLNMTVFHGFRIDISGTLIRFDLP